MCDRLIDGSCEVFDVGGTTGKISGLREEGGPINGGGVRR